MILPKFLHFILRLPSCSKDDALVQGSSEMFVLNIKGMKKFGSQKVYSWLWCYLNVDLRMQQRIITQQQFFLPQTGWTLMKEFNTDAGFRMLVSEKGTWTLLLCQPPKSLHQGTQIQLEDPKAEDTRELWAWRRGKSSTFSALSSRKRSRYWVGKSQNVGPGSPFYFPVQNQRNAATTPGRMD